MSYEENYFLPGDSPSAKAQRKSHERIITAITKYFKLNSPPPYTFLGLNPSKYVQELEQSKEGKLPKEIKEIDKKIMRVRDIAANNDKFIFDFNDPLKRLVITSNSIPVTGLMGSASYERWTALLDFPISDQFIFGRVCKKARHGSGTYCFAPINFPISGIEEIIEEKSQILGTDKVFLDIIQADPLIKILDEIRYTKEAMDQLRTMRQMIEEKELTGIKLIDNLNQNKKLVKKVESVGHFGAVQQGLSLFRSDADVSTVCLPIKGSAFIQLVNFEIYGHKKSIEGLFSLVNALREA
jgi:hypothetical protein